MSIKSENNVETIYFYKKDSNIYYSNISYDDAIKASSNDVSKLYSYSGKTSIINPTIILSPNVSGTIKWEDDYGNQYPLCGATITLAFENNISYETTISNNLDTFYYSSYYSIA